MLFIFSRSFENNIAFYETFVKRFRMARPVLSPLAMKMGLL